jgi:hypothetical protein
MKDVVHIAGVQEAGMDRIRKECWSRTMTRDADQAGYFDSPATGENLANLARCVSARQASDEAARRNEEAVRARVASDSLTLVIDNAKNGIASISLDFSGLKQRVPNAKTYAEDLLRLNKIHFAVQGDVITTNLGSE